MLRRTPSFKLEWEAHEYEHKERSTDWFWAVGIVSVSLAVTSIILGNIIFGLLILIGTAVLSLFALRPPETINVSLDEKGIVKGHVRYPYSSLESFWIDTDHPHKKIILQSEKLFMPLITVPLGPSTDIDKLHEKLSQVLTEKYHELPLIEKLLDYLGF